MANQLKAVKVLSIRALYAQGWSQRRIARELGVSRDAVARHLRDTRPISNQMKVGLADRESTAM